MRREYLPGILAGACLLLSGCPIPPPPPNLNEAINVVGADWEKSSLAWKDTGGPTVVPPKLTSNSSKSFDVEVTDVGAGHTLDDVAQLAFAIEPFGGHYVFYVGPDDRTPTGSILVTVVQQQAELTPGAFTLQVGAADATGDEVAIPDVSAAFFAASAGDDSMAEVGETVALDATFTGATGTPDVTWSQVSGPTVSIADPSAVNTTFVPPAIGTYVMKLEAADPTGVVDVDLVSILVVDAFTVDAGASKVITVGEAAELHGLAAGGTGLASFAWAEVSAFGVEIQDFDSRVASFVAPETGEYEFELTATDEIHGAVSDRVIYLAVDELTAVADAPEEAELGATIQLQGQAAGGLFPYAFRWTQTGGPEVDIEDATNQTALVSLETVGTYTFGLRVEDSTASAATDSVTTSVPCVVNSDCDDGNTCTTDACDVATGECLRDALVCDDGFDCTEDTCDPEFGCIFTDICQAGTVCHEGACKTVCTMATDCDDGVFCNGAETCSISEGETQGVCEPGTYPCEVDAPCNEENRDCWPCDTTDDCNDFNPCTTDSCDTAKAFCVFDDIVCDEDRVCVEGECIKTCTIVEDCDDGVFCNGAETCIDGLCEPGIFPCMTDEMCLEDTKECVELPALVFSDDFEGGYGLWYADNGVWQIGLPSSGPNSAFSGKALAATVLDGDYPGTSSRLVSPSINLPWFSMEREMHLLFVHWWEFASYCGCRGGSGSPVCGCWHDRGIVQIRQQTTPGQWTDWTTLESFSGSSPLYSNALVDLSGYMGKKVQIGFLLSYSGVGVAAGWYIDDVTIEAR